MSWRAKLRWWSGCLAVAALLTGACTSKAPDRDAAAVVDAGVETEASVDAPDDARSMSDAGDDGRLPADAPADLPATADAAPDVPSAGDGSAADAVVGEVGDDGGGDRTPSALPCGLLGLGNPQSMDLSPDGRLAAFGNDVGGVTIFALPSLTARRTISAHVGAVVTAVAFSPDSSRLVTAARDGRIRLWDVATVTPIWAATPVTGTVLQVSFASDGTLWALAVDGLRTIDVATGRAGAPVPGTGGALSFAIQGAGATGTLVLGRPTGELAIVAASDGHTVKSVPDAHTGAVTSVRVSADGRFIASGGNDGYLALWAAAGALVSRVTRLSAPVTSVDINSDGSLLSVGGSGLVTSVRPDGSRQGAGALFPRYGRLSMDSTFIITMEDADRVGTYAVDRSSTGTIWGDDWRAGAFSPDGKWLAEASGNDVLLWDPRTGELVRRLAIPMLHVPANAIAFSPDGVTLARTAWFDNKVRLMRVSDGMLLLTFAGAVTEATSIAFSPDGQWLAAPGPSGAVAWRVSDGGPAPASYPVGAGKPASVVAFSPEGSALAVGDGAGSIFVYDFQSGSLISRMDLLATPVTSIVFTPDGNRLVIADQVQQLLVGARGDLVSVLAGGGFAQPAIQVSPDGALLAGALPTPLGNDNFVLAIWLWSGTDGTPLATFPVLPAEAAAGETAHMRFIPGSHTVAYVSSSVRLYCLP